MGPRGGLVAAVLAGAPAGPAAAGAQSRSITLVTGSFGASPAALAGASADASTVLFVTAEDVPGTGDADGLVDVYRARGGASSC